MKITLLLFLFLFSFPLYSSADWDQRAEYIRSVHHYGVHNQYWLTQDVCQRYRNTIQTDIEVFCYEIPGLVIDDPSESEKYEDEIYALWTTEDYWVNTLTKKTRHKGKIVRLPIKSWSFGIPQVTVGTANAVLNIWRKKENQNKWENGVATYDNPVPRLLHRYPGFITGHDLLTDTDLSFAIGIWHYLGRRKAFLSRKSPLQTTIRCYNCGEGGLKKGLSFGYWDSVNGFLSYRHLWRNGFYVLKGKEKIKKFDFVQFVKALRGNNGSHLESFGHSHFACCKLSKKVSVKL